MKITRAALVAAITLLPLAASAAPPAPAPPKPSAATQKVIEAARVRNQKRDHNGAIALIRAALKKLPPKAAKDDRAALNITLSDSFFQAGQDLLDEEKFAAAIVPFKQSYALDVATDSPGAGVGANQIGYCYEQLKKYPEALDYYNRSLSAHRKFKNRERAGRLLHIIGDVLYDTRQYPKAIIAYTDALAVSRETGDVYGEGVLNKMLGNVHDDSAKFGEALAFYYRSLVLMRTQNDSFGEAGTLLDLMIYANNKSNPGRDGARAVFWGKQGIAVLQKQTPGKAADGDKERIASRYATLMTALEGVLTAEERESGAEAVKKIAATDVATSDALPLTTEEESLRAAYEATAKLVGDAGTALSIVRAKKGATATEKADAEAKLKTAQDAFAAFLTTLPGAL